MKKRIGMLTSGGDCAGLNAVIRAVVNSASRLGWEVYGIKNGTDGLTEKPLAYEILTVHNFSDTPWPRISGSYLGSLNKGVKMESLEEVSKRFGEGVKTLGLDAIVVVGGDGSMNIVSNYCKNAGVKMVGIPKTIDNDLWGTDMTFGFQSAVNVATHAIDCIHTTAASHGRVFIVEVMGHKVGWLTLYAGIAGGADIILIPELPYSIENVCAAIEKRAAQGKRFSILAVAEGVYDVKEARMKKKERMAKRAEQGYTTATNRIAKEIEELTGIETRICVPGHMQRGGSPSPYDRVLATQFGSYAAKMVEDGNYGITVAMKNNHVGENKLKDIAGKSRLVPEGHGMLEVARRMGISVG